MLLVEAEMLSVSALSLFAAISKDVLVLVLGSWKKWTMVLPRKVGTFLIGRVDISLSDSAVSRISEISSTERLSMSRISFFLNFTGLLDSLDLLG